MSKAPERIWETLNCNGEWTIEEGGGVEYVRADRIEELEEQLAKARTFLDELWDSQGYDARELHDLLKELDGDKR